MVNEGLGFSGDAFSWELREDLIVDLIELSQDLRLNIFIKERLLPFLYKISKLAFKLFRQIASACFSFPVCSLSAMAVTMRT
jgi:hypothetical protein